VDEPETGGLLCLLRRLLASWLGAAPAAAAAAAAAAHAKPLHAILLLKNTAMFC
jgi:hypothetical protein